MSKSEQIVFEGINANRGLSDEVMRDIGYDTLATLPATIDRLRDFGGEAVGPIFHVNQIGREPKLRNPPKATTPREKLVADADRVPDHIKVPPHGHDQ